MSAMLRSASTLSFASVSLVVVSVGASACGGNVVFVGDGEGGDGSGAGSTGFSATAAVGQGGASTSQTNGSAVTVSVGSTSTGSGTFCQNDVCEIGQTVCSCDGQCSVCNDIECFLISTRTECHWVEDGAQCDCLLTDGTTGTILGTCFQGNLDCDTTTGCCAPLFQEAILNGP
jgi:hypothetical protein